MESNHEQLEAMVVGRVENLERHEAGHCVLIDNLRNRVQSLEYTIWAILAIVLVLAYAVSKMKGGNGNQ